MKQNKPSGKAQSPRKEESKTRLVYSSAGEHLKLCKKCGEDPCECADSPLMVVEVLPSATTLKLRLEKNQRGGKLVTVIHNLPVNPPYFEELARKLKNHCGTGGTFKGGGNAVIELQGDQREKVQGYLEKMGFVVKRSGG